MFERSLGRAAGRAPRAIWMATSAIGAALAAVALMPQAARADCAAVNSIISCTGTTNGYGDGTQAGQTITVEGGATVLDSAPAGAGAINVGASNTVNNAGGITGNQNGVAASGSIIVNNTANIASNGGAAVRSGGEANVNSTGTLSGVIGVEAGGLAKVTNSGTVAAIAQAVKGGSVSLVNSGTVVATFVGVEAGAGGAGIINQGTIRATGATGVGISSNGGLTLDNSGNIGGSVNTLTGDATIANTGSIAGGAQAGVYTAGRLSLNNSGQMTGVGAGVATVSAGTVNLANSGQISALGAGSDAVAAFGDMSGSNSGQITAGNNASAVHAFNNLNFTNVGTLGSGNTTSGGQAATVRADGLATVVNRGNIVTGSSGANIAILGGAGANVTNEARITATGAQSVGISSAGDVRLNNSGNISATGAGARALFSGGSANVTNSASIAASDTALHATFIIDVTNSSTISAGAVGVRSDDVANVTNSGSILAPTGVRAGVARVTNSGVVGAGGAGSVGVSGDRAVNVNNSGLITGETGVAVTTGGASSTIVNTGRIVGSGGTAIRLTNAPDTLTLAAGSKIEGLVALGGGGDTVNIDTANSGSQVIVFDNLAGATVNVTGGKGGHAVGNSIVIVDATNLAANDSALMQVTGAVSNLATRRAGNATAAKGDTTKGFWAQGIGGAQRQQARGATSGWTNSFGGMVAGYEGAPYADMRIGAFVGGAMSGAQAQQDRASGTYAFGGVYGRFQPGALFVDFNLVGGYVAETNKRTITSNVAAGGVETARARINGYYVSPQVGLGYRVQYDQSGAITPAARVRYVAAQYGSYTESGATAPIAGAARSYQAIEARGEIELSRMRRSANGTSLRLYETVGVVSQTRLNGGVASATILGSAISLSNPTQASTIAGFFGAGVEWTRARGATLFANFEAEVRLDRSIAAHARAGAAWTF